MLTLLVWRQHSKNHCFGRYLLFVPAQNRFHHNFVSEFDFPVGTVPSILLVQPRISLPWSQNTIQWWTYDSAVNWHPTQKLLGSESSQATGWETRELYREKSPWELSNSEEHWDERWQGPELWCSLLSPWSQPKSTPLPWFSITWLIFPFYALRNISLFSKAYKPKIKYKFKKLM